MHRFCSKIMLFFLEKPAQNLSAPPAQTIGYDLVSARLVGDTGFANFMAKSEMGDFVVEKAPGSLKIYLLL